MEDKPKRLFKSIKLLEQGALAALNKKNLDDLMFMDM